MNRDGERNESGKNASIKQTKQQQQCGLVTKTFDNQLLQERCEGELIKSIANLDKRRQLQSRLVRWPPMNASNAYF